MFNEINKYIRLLEQYENLSICFALSKSYKNGQKLFFKIISWENTIIDIIVLLKNSF